MKRGARMAEVSIVPTRDGVWTVNERGPRLAISYFPTKWQALKHALRVAKAMRRCRVSLLGRDGGVRLSREYSGQDRETNFVETP
jgi:hypothetical protein